MHELFCRIHEALTIEEIQSGYLAAVDRVIGSRGFGIYHHDSVFGPASRMATRDVDDRFLSDYDTVGRGCDPVLRRLVDARRPIASHQVMGDAEWARQPFYSVLARAGFNHTLIGPIVVDGVLVGTVNMARAAGDLPFSAGDLRRLDIIVRQLSIAHRRAYRLAQRERVSGWRDPSQGAGRLSPREREIVDLVTRGLNNRQIAEVASISPNTVKQHLKRVFEKIGVDSRAELAARAVSERLI